MLEKIAFFASTSKRVEWLTERQRVIAGNVANANTPGYKARDVASFDSMLTRAPTSTLSQTHERHMAGSQGAAVDIRVDPTSWEESLDGNTVVLEQLTIRANETFEQFNLATRAYKKGYELLTLAMVGNR